MITPDQVKTAVQIKSGFDSLPIETVTELCCEAVGDIVRGTPLAGIFCTSRIHHPGVHRFERHVRQITSVKFANTNVEAVDNVDYRIGNYNGIEIFTPGVYHIEYYAYPLLLDQKSNEPIPVPYEFEDAVIAYVTAYFAGRLYGPNSPEASDYRAEYNAVLYTSITLLSESRSQRRVFPSHRRHRCR